MGAGHGHKVHFHGHSWLHRAPAHLKIVGLLVVMVAVVAVPKGWSWQTQMGVYGGVGVGLAGLAVSSHIPLVYLAKRLVIETPVVAFALILPFVATGPTVEFFGVDLSRAGLVGGSTLLAKATLGVFGAVLVAATTEPRAILTGLARLRLPRQLVQIAAFMVRYLDVVTDEWRRMSVARISRGFSASNPRHWPILARSLGVLFIRSYERGERVHLAMLSRGYDGRMPR